MQIYIPLKPHATGHPQGGGYQCGACGLQGLQYGEPHYRSGDGSSSMVCEPAVPTELVANHPQAQFAGKSILARAAIGLGLGALLERRNDLGAWKKVDLGPPLVNVPRTDVTTTPPVAEPLVEPNAADVHADETVTVPPANNVPVNALTDVARAQNDHSGFVDALRGQSSQSQSAPGIDGTLRAAGHTQNADQPLLPGSPTAGVPAEQVPPTFTPGQTPVQGGGALSTSTPEGDDGEKTT
jgi:hypothetical protein